MKILFSHHYKKLQGPSGEVKTATLLDVIPVVLENLSPEFLAYDTDDGLFELPKIGHSLLLIFRKGDTSELFTTLRKDIPQTVVKYRGAIGKVFDIEYMGSKEVTE